MKNKLGIRIQHEGLESFIDDLIKGHLDQTKIMLEEQFKTQDAEKYGIMGYNTNNEIIDL
jgi:hypothetical protein